MTYLFIIKQIVTEICGKQKLIKNFTFDNNQ